MNSRPVTSRLPVVLLAILVVGAVPIGVMTVSADGYRISIDGSVDTPDRTVTVKGDDYLITEVASANPSETIDVDVSAPADQTYSVVVYNGDSQIADSESGSGDATVSFDMSDLDPGSYTVVIDATSGGFEAVQPLVVSDYGVSVDSPDGVAADESLDASIDVSEITGSKPIDSVELVIGNEDRTVRTTASEKADGSYEATVTGDRLPEGDYRVYAVVRGENEAFGEKEILGISDANDVEVTEASETTQPSQGGTGGTGGGSGSGSRESTTTGTATPTATTSTPTPTATPTETATATETPTETATETTTDSGVITANEDTGTTAGTTSSEGQPGFGPVAALVALLSLASIAKRRS